MTRLNVCLGCGTTVFGTNEDVRHHLTGYVSRGFVACCPEPRYLPSDHPEIVQAGRIQAAYGALRAAAEAFHLAIANEPRQQTRDHLQSIYRNIPKYP
jgi:hypothetical protein